MARIRTIKPAFFSSITISGLKIPTRLTFIGLWTYVDDAGRGVDDARLIKAELWPLDDNYTAKKVEADLEAMAKTDLIERYVVDGRRYLRVRGWSEHQKINKPQPSKLPSSPEEILKCDEAGEDASRTTPPPGRDHSGNAPGTGTEPSPPEGNGREGIRKGSPSPPAVSSPPGGAGTGEEEIYIRTLDLAADRDLARATDAGEPIRDPDAYRRRCREKRASQHGAELRRLIATHTSWPPEKLLDALDGQPITTVPDAEQTAAWLDQQRTHEAEIADAAAQADAAIAALDDQGRAELRARAEAEVTPVGGRRPAVLVTAAMRRLALDTTTSGT